LARSAKGKRKIRSEEAGEEQKEQQVNNMENKKEKNYSNWKHSIVLFYKKNSPSTTYHRQ